MAPTRPRTEQIRSATQSVGQQHLEDWIEDIQARVDAISTINVITLEDDVATLQAEVINLQTAIQANANDIDNVEISLAADIDAVETQLSALEDRVLDLESSLSFTITYGINDRIDSIDYQNGDQTQFVYDNDENIAQVITSSETKTLNYDVNGNLTGITVS